MTNTNRVSRIDMSYGGTETDILCIYDLSYRLYNHDNLKQFVPGKHIIFHISMVLGHNPPGHVPADTYPKDIIPWTLTPQTLTH